MATLAPLTGPATVEVRIGGGAGGMGEVYRAHDPRLDRDVAVKVLPSHLSGNASALARFEREAKVLAALSHPNILAVFDVGSENGVSFVVMELLPGQTSSAGLLSVAWTGLMQSAWESRLRMVFPRRSPKEQFTAI